MKLILITGKTGSGKNKLGDCLSEKNDFTHIDIDKICHTCYENENIVNQVKMNFGDDIIFQNQVDRKKLGAIVFNDKSKLKILNDITYNYVINKIDCIISKSEKPVLLNYVLLPNTKYWDTASFKILVKSHDDNQRFERLIERDKVSKEYIISRDKNSLNYDEKNFDYIFINDYSEKNLLENVEIITKKILEKDI